MARTTPQLGSHEFDAICREAFEAYDYQGERIRFDTLGRRWTFEPAKIAPGESVLRLRLARLGEAKTDTISTAVLASDMAAPMIADVCRALAEGVG